MYIKYIIVLFFLIILIFYLNKKELFNNFNVEDDINITYDISRSNADDKSYFNIKQHQNNSGIYNRADYLKKTKDSFTKKPNFYHEHIDIGINKPNSVAGVIQDPNTMMIELKNLNKIDYRLMKDNNISLYNEISKDKNNFKEKIKKIEQHSILLEADIENTEATLDIKESKNAQINQVTLGNKQSFNSIRDYHNYQLLKKKDKPINHTDFGVSRTDLKKIFTSLTDSDNLPTNLYNDSKNYLQDLYGEPHAIQERTEYQVVSRGINKTDESNYIYDDLDDVNKKKLTPVIQKSCPIMTKKTYTLQDILDIDISNMDEQTKRRYTTSYDKNYAGTYKFGENRCKECDYPMGCLNNTPYERKAMYEYQPCTNGRNRICKPCDKCKLGETFVKTICGEGGSHVNTECKRCKKCNNDEYKAFGCDHEQTLYDTICIKKTKCYGKDDGTVNYKDPGENNRTYLSKKGITGCYDNRILEDGTELKAPYIGKDNECKKCDICPSGFIHLKGCMGLNDVSNTVCQRYINIDDYINKSIENGVIEKPFFFNKEKLKEKINDINENLALHDNFLRKQYFIENDKGEYVGVTRLGKSKNLSLNDINNPKIYENVSGNLEDYMSPKFIKAIYQ